MSKIKISFFHDVTLYELITKHLTCNYQLCTVTKLFGLVTSKCIMICLGKGAQINFLSKIEIFFVHNAEHSELITITALDTIHHVPLLSYLDLHILTVLWFFWDGGLKYFFCPKSKFFYHTMKSSTNWSRINPLVISYHVALLSYLDL